MSRPAVSVVMPFAGTPADAAAALAALLALELRAGDELIVADNSGTVPPTPGVSVVPATGERSPAYARNAGAEHASGEWILFLDADCRPRQGLLDAYFAMAVDPRVGALAGSVIPAAGAGTLAARYGAARNFLSLDAHLAHPFRPRAVAANLMVRRVAFTELGGFFEGLRAAEDTDFSWRLQEAAWRLEGRPEAVVEHHYRASIPELRRQWRGYAAGRAWLARRYPGFSPEPAVVRGARRVVVRGARRVVVRGVGRAVVRGARRVVVRDAGRAAGGLAAPPRTPGPRTYLALDALLALDELAGFALSNRPAHGPPPPAALVLVADRFPASANDSASVPAGARVEAARRPDVIDPRAARHVSVSYREDDGIGARVFALARLIIRHPVRCTRSLVEKAPLWFAFSTRLRHAQSLAALAPAAVRHAQSLGALAPAAVRLAQSLGALAPAALRVARDRGAHVRALDPLEAATTARTIAVLAGAPLDEPGRS